MASSGSKKPCFGLTGARLMGAVTVGLLSFETSSQHSRMLTSSHLAGMRVCGQGQVNLGSNTSVYPYYSTDMTLFGYDQGIFSTSEA